MTTYPRLTQKNPSHDYSSPYRWLHWTIATGCIVLLIAGQQFNLPLSDAYRSAGLSYHSSIGTVVLICALYLFFKRFVRRDTRPNHNLPMLKKIIATGVHLALYSLAIFIPLTGLLAAYYAELPVLLFGLVDISRYTAENALYTQIRRVHELATFLAMALILAHAWAACYHHWVQKDRVLSAMLDVDHWANRWQALCNKLGR
ncbi:cytochrome b [Reinekea sp.]|uniref:cytochrome b n=1 Tax=Reinekea sp. TaxID=1970455 RepID=UPI002A7F098D|nr:cytochrome b/b6 domain-containing protein [Reinekea sp.]